MGDTPGSLGEPSQRSFDGSSATNPFQTIPERVTCLKLVNVDASKIEGAGRGIIALENVKPGDLIFKISKPMFAVVASTKDALKACCDNCFASKHQMSGVATVPSQDIGFLSCSRCNIMYYCSKECQTEAWHDHHKFECKTLKKMGLWGVDEKSNVIDLARIRLTVRILQMDAKGSIPDAQWVELQALNANKEYSEDNKSAVYFQATTIAEALAETTDTNRSKKEIANLISTLETNELAISLDLLRPYGSDYTFDRPPQVHAGASVDPFCSMMNHSCDPNALWRFEGREIRVVATQPISIGEEIYISYIRDCGAYKARRDALQTGWSFTCTCKLCQRGPLGLSAAGNFGERVLKLAEGTPDSVEKLVELPKILVNVRNNFGYSTYPLCWFYKWLWVAQVLKGDRAQALKICLTMYYLVEPCQSPPIQPEDHLDTQYHLINTLVGLKLSGFVEEDTMFIYLHLRALRIRTIEKSLGGVSMLSQFERDDFQKALDKMNRHGKKFIPLTESPESKVWFVKAMNKLLNWAGIPLRTAEQLCDGA